MNKNQLAKEYFMKGANCAQAVLCAFAPECGLTEESAMRIASGFGGGVGRLREVCGAVSGMILVAGFVRGYTSFEDKKVKDEHYALVQELAGAFRRENGSIVCRELLGLSGSGGDSPVSAPRTAEFYKKRPCAELVAMAAGIVQSVLFEQSGGEQ